MSSLTYVLTSEMETWIRSTVDLFSIPVSERPQLVEILRELVLASAANGGAKALDWRDEREAVHAEPAYRRFRAP